MKTPVTCVALLALGLTGLVACTPAPKPIDAAKEEAAIRDLEASWSKQLGAKDLPGFVSHYTDDAILYSSGMPLERGTAQIKAGMQEAFKDPNFSLSFAPERVSVAKSGDLAYTTGAYSGSMSDPKTKAKVQMKGQYVTVYVRTNDGRWLAKADFAGDLPLTAAPAAKP